MRAASLSEDAKAWLETTDLSQWANEIGERPSTGLQRFLKRGTKPTDKLWNGLLTPQPSVPVLMMASTCCFNVTAGSPSIPHWLRLPSAAGSSPQYTPPLTLKYLHVHLFLTRQSLHPSLSAPHLPFYDPIWRFIHIKQFLPFVIFSFDFQLNKISHWHTLSILHADFHQSPSSFLKC